MIKHLRGRAQYVFWNISLGPRSERIVSMNEIFKTIIFQALQHSGQLFTDFAEQLNLSELQSSHTDREWVDLICLLFMKLPEVSIVLETEDLHKMYRHDRDWIERFLNQ
ncbi:hypothetical protein P154DRAFT_596826 [Amniculicola lignicola CBS 123094]|uniref:Uncharacterized protein n=1 Tax=Amniculicola lignicola CBS 123094 TaxID=1392246 RepID=A0A6A5WIF2_9PLEO|nr:hypothetical protein P154DRAFT_596826 [Amniculicola lignicola CBS 123094]